jgi:diguanylate cyclase (GGDEF)-like protein
MLCCLAVDIALLGAGIGIARFLAPKTIIIFASVLIVPVFFISNTLPTLVLFILNAASFTAIGINSMEPETFRWTLTNLLIFSSVGIVLGYFINKTRFERYYFAESAFQLAESNAKLAELQTRYAYYDQMTGLLNRRAYEEKIDQFMENMPHGCCVIMADINGLKKMNDTYGHEAGDELIIGTAECLRQSFNNIETIYRIGGDEFCVIMNGTPDDAEECLRKTESAGNQWNGKFVNGISISYGFASDKEFDDFDSMLKAADQRMYAFKRNYYISSGHDRRHR